MKSRSMKLLTLSATIALNLTLCGAVAFGATTPPDEGPGAPEYIASGTQIAQVEGFDWGPGVTKTILSLDQTVTADSVTAAKFCAIENKQTYDYEAYAKVAKEAPYTRIEDQTHRIITAAYTCDANGNRTRNASSHIALELKCTPSEGSAFYYSAGTSQNSWCGFYNLQVDLIDDTTLTTDGGRKITLLSVDPSISWTNALLPDLKDIDLSGTFTSSKGDKMTYASYVPANASETHKRPLVIWLHGAGEGGVDPSIVLLGNKVTALTGTNFQNRMGGAYVLAPQIPDFWMTYDANGSWQDNPGTDSVHLTGLKELIDQYVKDNPGIDTDRILIGGCSNGGYMTMDMVLNYPDYFAAAFPICEAYKDASITDGQLQAIKNVPIWFVYAKNDTTVDPSKNAAPTVSRLKAMGANVHASVFDDVHDTTGLYKDEDGAAHQYAGHWSWLYFFNDECASGKLPMWTWMAQQSK